MKLNKIISFFFIGLPICVCLRIFQIMFTIELETGFYVNEFATIGKAISAVILNESGLMSLFMGEKFDIDTFDFSVQRTFQLFLSFPDI